jgi:ABC-type glutathione transport system ATPase component
MRQRVMIAMALSCNPSLLIADEPTTALDVTIQAQIIDLLLSLQEQMGMAILMITHDLGVIAETCRRVIVMYAGKVMEGREHERALQRHAAPVHDRAARIDSVTGAARRAPQSDPGQGARSAGSAARVSFLGPLQVCGVPLRQRRHRAARSEQRPLDPLLEGRASWLTRWCRTNRSKPRRAGATGHCCASRT